MPLLLLPPPCTTLTRRRWRQRLHVGGTWGLQGPQLLRLAAPSTPEAVQALVASLSIAPPGASVQQVLHANAADATSAALLAAAALGLQGRAPLLLKLFARDGLDHTLALFQCQGRWGAVSRRGPAGGGWRDPVYRDLRELVLSYLHEYGCGGRKTLLGYGDPFDLRRLEPRQWLIDEQGGLGVERRLLRWGLHLLYDPASVQLREHTPA